MIASFRDRQTERLWQDGASRGFPPDVIRPALLKLAMVDAALVLDDLREPPGNRLEALRGDRRGQYSIRVNSRWRICFVWAEGSAHDVELVDYH